MFGINKNGTKHKVGIIMPSFFPSSRVTYDGGTVEEMLDGKVLASVTADGVKTYATLLNELYALLDTSEITPHSRLETGGQMCCVSTVSPTLRFTATLAVSTNWIDIRAYVVRASNSQYVQGALLASSNTTTDQSASVPANGTSFTIYK